MRRFVRGWKTLGYQERYQAFVVNHADDLVLCCRGSAPEALAAMRNMMARLRLTVNESKTRACAAPQETFDFLGYTFGRLWSPRTGRPYVGGVCPSKKRIQRICARVSELTDRRTTSRSVAEVVADLNRKHKIRLCVHHLDDAREPGLGLDLPDRAERQPPVGERVNSFSESRMWHIRMSGSMSGTWKRSKVEFLRRRQTKGPATDRLRLNHRATFRLYLLDFCQLCA